jgi:hypothetical protein
MTKADSVHSTPPTNTPTDTTRRLLTVAVAGAPALARPPTAAALEADPIFAAIGRYKGAAVVRMGEIASMLFDNPDQGPFIFAVTHPDDMLQDLRKRYYAESFQP